MTDLLTRTAVPQQVDAAYQEIQCECDHPDGQCTNTARLVVAYHCIHRCKQPSFEPHGDTTECLCMTCFQTLVCQIVDSILSMVVRGCPPLCSTCRKPTRNPAEIIREVRPL